MKKENCIVAQSGGPTAAINASLAGVIDGVRKSGSFTRIYGSLHGITGVLENNMMDMSLMALSHFPMLNTLELTPAMYLGSCRYKLPDYTEDPAPYKQIFERFEEYGISAFFYIGGNDSMDTVLKLSNYANPSSQMLRSSEYQRRSTTICLQPTIHRALALLPNMWLPPY